MTIEQVKIDQLKFADYNPRIITEKQVEDLKASIEKFGVVEPVVVNKRAGRENIIVGGHQRVRILKILNHEEVPVVWVDLDEAAEKELNIRLNKNGGTFDWSKLANEFSVDDLIQWGFTEGELGMQNSGKDDIDRDNLGGTLDSYLDGGIRQIVLYFKKEEYDEVLLKMDKYMKELGVESHSETFKKMLEHYESRYAVKRNENPRT